MLLIDGRVSRVSDRPADYPKEGVGREPHYSSTDHGCEWSQHSWGGATLGEAWVELVEALWAEPAQRDGVEPWAEPNGVGGAMGGASRGMGQGRGRSQHSGVGWGGVGWGGRG